MKYSALLCLLAVGCSGCSTPDSSEQPKRVWVMSDDDNWYFAVKEPDGRLSMLSTCTRVAMWKGLHADILVRWHTDADLREGGCYYVDAVIEVQPEEKSK